MRERVSTSSSNYDRLKPKQKAFVDYYLSELGNATEAARKAGYRGNDRTLQSVGKENLSKPLIAEAIKERQDLIESKRLKTLEEALVKLGQIAFDDSRGPAQVAALVSFIKLRSHNGEEAKEKSEIRKAQVKYIEAKTAEVGVAAPQDDGLPKGVIRGPLRGQLTEEERAQAANELEPTT